MFNLRVYLQEFSFVECAAVPRSEQKCSRHSFKTIDFHIIGDHLLIAQVRCLVLYVGMSNVLKALFVPPWQDITAHTLFRGFFFARLDVCNQQISKENKCKELCQGMCVVGWLNTMQISSAVCMCPGAFPPKMWLQRPIVCNVTPLPPSVSWICRAWDKQSDKGIEAYPSNKQARRKWRDNMENRTPESLGKWQDTEGNKTLLSR